jgi:hypothetical protein
VDGHSAKTEDDFATRGVAAGRGTGCNEKLKRKKSSPKKAAFLKSSPT